MSDNPFADLLPGQQQPPPQQPTTIGGTRVLGGVPPSERRAEEDQALDRARLGIAADSNDRQNRAEQRGAVGEQQAYTLVSRVGGGIEDINFVYTTWPGAKDAPSASETVLYSTFGPNSIFTRGLTNDGRRALEDTQRDIIDALLTLGTGAAYTDEQLETYRASYFPQYNDSDEMIQLKQRRLKRAFEEAIPRAGPLGERLRQYQTAMLGDGSEIKEPTAQDRAPAGYRSKLDNDLGFGDNEPFDRVSALQERFGITPEAETRLIGLLNANRGNPNLTMDSLRQIYTDAGVPLPDEAGLKDLLEQMQSNTLPASAINTKALEEEYVEGLDAIIDKAGFTPEAQGDTAALSTRQGASLEGFDELVGVGNAIAEGLQLNNPIEGYRIGRDVTRRLDQRGSAANPATNIAGRVAGGIVTAGTGAGHVQTARQAAKIGLIEGGTTGFNAGEGLTNSLVGAGIGAPTGAALGSAIHIGGQKVVNALAKPKNVNAGQAQEIFDAGQRMRVTTRRADVDPTVRGKRGQVQQTPRGREAINAADASDLQEMETALIQNLGGSTSRRTEAGEVIQGGVRQAREDLRANAGKYYTLADRDAGQITAAPRSAIAKIDEHIAELTANGAEANAKRIGKLESLKRDLTQNGGLSIRGIRAQRTDLRTDLQNDNLYTGDFERRLNEVLDAASSDIEAALASNPTALANYREADRLWTQQANLGKDIGDVLLGRKGDLGSGQAADKILLWAKKDPARMNRLLEEVPDDIKGEVRALVVGQLGRSSNGSFSLNQFLTATGDGTGSKISPAALRSLFGKEGAEAIKDLRILAQAKVDAADARNYSNTGGLIERARNSVRRLILGGFGFGVAADAGTGLGVAAAGAASATGEFFERLGRERAIRLVLNPDFTGWLRKLPNSNEPRVINGSLARLRSIAARTPGMTADIQAFERMLLDVANDNAGGVTSAVAEEPKN